MHIKNYENCPEDEQAKLLPFFLQLEQEMTKKIIFGKPGENHLLLKPPSKLALSDVQNFHH